MSTHIDSSGLLTLSVDLKRASKEMLPLIRVATQKTAQDIKADAQALAPVDTGYLRGSITYETRVRASSIFMEVGPGAEYGGYVEFGTTRQAPQPYMTPAFERRAPLYEQALDQIMSRLL